MSTVTQPERGTRDLNPVRFIAEHLPGQIRTLQAKLRDNARDRARMETELQVLLQHAVLQGVELCPAPGRGEPESPAPTNTPPGLAGTDGADVRGAAR